MKKLMLLALVLVGCAHAPRGTEVVEGNEVSVVVSWWDSNQGRNGALEAADAHCAKFGRKAQFSGNVSDFRIAYNCIK